MECESVNPQMRELVHANLFQHLPILRCAFLHPTISENRARSSDVENIQRQALIDDLFFDVLLIICIIIYRSIGQLSYRFEAALCLEILHVKVGVAVSFVVQPYDVGYLRILIPIP